MRVTTILNGWWHWQVLVSYAALLTAFLCTARQVWQFSSLRSSLTTDKDARDAVDQVLDTLMLPLNYCYLATATVRVLRAQHSDQELMIATVASANAWQSWALWSVLKLLQRVVATGSERSGNKKSSNDLKDAGSPELAASQQPPSRSIGESGLREERQRSPIMTTRPSLTVVANLSQRDSSPLRPKRGSGLALSRQASGDLRQSSRRHASPISPSLCAPPQQLDELPQSCEDSTQGLSSKPESCTMVLHESLVIPEPQSTESPTLCNLEKCFSEATSQSTPAKSDSKSGSPEKSDSKSDGPRSENVTQESLESGSPDRVSRMEEILENMEDPPCDLQGMEDEEEEEEEEEEDLQPTSTNATQESCITSSVGAACADDVQENIGEQDGLHLHSDDDSLDEVSAVILNSCLNDEDSQPKYMRLRQDSSDSNHVVQPLIRQDSSVLVHVQEDACEQEHADLYRDEDVSADVSADSLKSDPTKVDIQVDSRNAMQDSYDVDHEKDGIGEQEDAHLHRCENVLDAAPDVTSHSDLNDKEIQAQPGNTLQDSPDFLRDFPDIACVDTVQEDTSEQERGHLDRDEDFSADVSADSLKSDPTREDIQTTSRNVIQDSYDVDHELDGIGEQEDAHLHRCENVLDAVPDVTSHLDLNDNEIQAQPGNTLQDFPNVLGDVLEIACVDTVQEDTCEQERAHLDRDEHFSADVSVDGLTSHLAKDDIQTHSRNDRQDSSDVDHEQDGIGEREDAHLHRCDNVLDIEPVVTANSDLNDKEIQANPTTTTQDLPDFPELACVGNVREGIVEHEIAQLHEGKDAPLLFTGASPVSVMDCEPSEPIAFADATRECRFEEYGQSDETSRGDPYENDVSAQDSKLQDTETGCDDVRIGSISSFQMVVEQKGDESIIREDALTPCDLSDGPSGFSPGSRTADQLRLKSPLLATRLNSSPHSRDCRSSTSHTSQGEDSPPKSRSPVLATRPDRSRQSSEEVTGSGLRGSLDSRRRASGCADQLRNDITIGKEGDRFSRRNSKKNRATEGRDTPKGETVKRLDWLLSTFNSVTEVFVSCWVMVQVFSSIFEILIKGVVGPYLPTYCYWASGTCTGCSDYFNSSYYPVFEAAVVLLQLCAVLCVWGYERSFKESIERAFKDSAPVLTSKSLLFVIFITLGQIMICQFRTQSQRVESFMFHSLLCCIEMAVLAVYHHQVYSFGGNWRVVVIGDFSCQSGGCLGGAKHLFVAAISCYASVVIVSWLIPPEWDIASIQPIANKTCDDNLYSRIAGGNKTEHMLTPPSMSPFLPLCQSIPLRCEEGFAGTPSVSCRPDSSSLAFRGKCTIVGCGPPSAIPHAVAQTNKEGSKTPHGSQVWTKGMRVVYDCVLGYHGSPVAVCEQDGTWNVIGSECSLIGCGALQSFLKIKFSTGWTNVMSPSVGNKSLLTSSHDGEVVKFDCNKGLLGKPVATCLKGGSWILSDACTAFKTAKGCACERKWTYCEGLLSNVCRDYFGCASNSEYSYSWCNVIPGSCPRSSLSFLELEPTWDYCAASNFHNIWEPVPVARQGWLPLIRLLGVSLFFFLFFLSAAMFAWCCFCGSKKTFITWQSLQPRVLEARDSCSFTIRHIPGCLRRYWRIFSYTASVRVEHLEVWLRTRKSDAEMWLRRRKADVEMWLCRRRTDIAMWLSRRKTDVVSFTSKAGDRSRSFLHLVKQGLLHLTNGTRDRWILLVENVKIRSCTCASCLRERCCPVEASDNNRVLTRCNSFWQNACGTLRHMGEQICNLVPARENLSAPLRRVNGFSLKEHLLRKTEQPSAEEEQGRSFQEGSLSQILPAGSDKERAVAKQVSPRGPLTQAKMASLGTPARNHHVDSPRHVSPSRNQVRNTSAAAVCKPPGLAYSMPSGPPLRQAPVSIPRSKPIEPPRTLDLATSPRF